MIWSIFDNDAHKIVSKKGLNLIEMENKLDKQLAKETVKSLSDFIKSKRDEDIERWAETARTKINQIVYCCSGENEEHIFDIGFIEGYEKARINCDVESAARELHIYNLGLNDGYNKAGYKKSEETLYTEEEIEEVAKKHATNTGMMLYTSSEKKESFIAGAKWQQEQDKNKYSEEEVIAFGKSCFYKGFDKSENNDANCYTAFREEIGSIIEQFKKK